METDLSTVLYNETVKHLQGKHDQKTHGRRGSNGVVREESDIYKDANRLKKIHYEETKKVDSDKLVNDGNWGRFIVLNDGTFAHCAGPGYFYHTYLAAGRILSHPEKYEPEQIARARKIIDGKYDEDLEIESAVGEREQSLSFSRGLERRMGEKTDVKMVVKGTGSTIFESNIDVVNRSFRLIKKLIKNGSLSGVDQFYFHGVDQVFSPEEVEEISSISKYGIPHYKHLQGQHDQKLHGRWATRYGSDFYYTHERWSGDIKPSSVSDGLANKMGYMPKNNEKQNYNHMKFIQGWSDHIENLTGISPIDETNTFILNGRMSGGVLGAIINFADMGMLLVDDKGYINKTNDKGETTAVVSGAAIFAHEIGHALESAFWEQGERWELRNSPEIARGKESFTKFKKNWEDSKEFDHFTEYSGKNFTEAFAECFSLYLNAGGLKRNKSIVPPKAEKVFFLIDDIVSGYQVVAKNHFDIDKYVPKWKSTTTKHLYGQHDQRTHGRWSTGKRDITQTPEFKKWFGNSKVVDENGKPLMVYRGDAANLDVFDGKGGPKDFLEGNVFFTNKLSIARFYAQNPARGLDAEAVGESHGLYRSYLSMQNPLIIKARKNNWASIPVPKELRTENYFPGQYTSIDNLAQQARKSGLYDGMIVKNVKDQYGLGDQYVVFSSDQIKTIDLDHSRLKHLSGKHDQKLHGRWAKSGEDRRVGTSRIVGISSYPKKYTDYGTSEAARNGLVNPIRSIQSRMDELDEKIKDCTVRIKKMREEYKLLDKEEYTDEVRDRMRYLTDQEWKIRYQEQGKYQKERAKLSKQRDELAREWLEGMQAKDPLNPGIVLGNEEIEKYYLSILKDKDGNPISPEAHSEALEVIHKNYILDADNERDVKQADTMSEAIFKVSDIVDRSVFGEKKPVVQIGISPFSSFYRPSTKTVHIVNMGGAYDKIIHAHTAHELGHWIEDNAKKEVRDRINEFYERRTQNSKETPIQKGSKIMVKKDKFVDPYIGRAYNSKSGVLDTTEVLSVGMELLFSDPYRLATRDPEMFDLVISVVRGVPLK